MPYFASAICTYCCEEINFSFFSCCCCSIYSITLHYFTWIPLFFFSVSSIVSFCILYSCCEIHVIFILFVVWVSEWAWQTACLFVFPFHIVQCDLKLMLCWVFSSSFFISSILLFYYRWKRGTLRIKSMDNNKKQKKMHKQQQLQ